MFSRIETYTVIDNTYLKTKDKLLCIFFFYFFKYTANWFFYFWNEILFRIFIFMCVEETVAGIKGYMPHLPNFYVDSEDPNSSQYLHIKSIIYWVLLPAWQTIFNSKSMRLLKCVGILGCSTLFPAWTVFFFQKMLLWLGSS